MGYSRSGSGCRRIPVSAYCGKTKTKSRRSSKRRSRKSRRRSSKSRSKRGACKCSRKARGSRRKSSRRSKKRRKCRPGVKTINPFLNYLRVFRQKHCGWPQRKVAIEGAKCWCKLSDEQRQKFYKEACSMRNKGKKGKSRKSRKRRSRSRRRKKKKGGKCPT